MTITYHCRNCDQPHEVEVYLGSPAIVHGPPEKCDPGDGHDWLPGACENCGQEFDDGKMYDLIEQEIENERANAAEDAAERRAEREWDQ